MTALTIAPNKLFEFQKDGVVAVQSLFQVRPVAASSQVIAATAGKRIRVLGIITQTTGAIGSMQFLSGNAGTILYSFVNPPNTGIPLIITPNMLGLFETDTGVGLFDVINTTQATYTIQYIVYTP